LVVYPPKPTVLRNFADISNSSGHSPDGKKLMDKPGDKHFDAVISQHR